VQSHPHIPSDPASILHLLPDWATGANNVVVALLLL
jgi:hypothetical protein